jgi:hypothetical protein
MSHKLIIGETKLDDFEYIINEKNSKEPANMYITGPFMMAEETNKNRRIYNLDDMVRDVQRYNEEFVVSKRALGELDHPESADVNLDRVCHVVESLKQDGNLFLGKSKILSSPCGLIVKSLINDGVRVGVSTRALGRVEEKNGLNYVNEMRLIAVDCVADPSCPKAFVNGILESKEWVLKGDNKYEMIYDEFTTAISDLPKRDVDQYLREHIIKFIKNLSLNT